MTLFNVRMAVFGDKVGGYYNENLALSPEYHHGTKPVMQGGGRGAEPDARWQSMAGLHITYKVVWSAVETH